MTIDDGRRDEFYFGFHVVSGDDKGIWGKVSEFCLL
jgi:hypothetical protein